MPQQWMETMVYSKLPMPFNLFCLYMAVLILLPGGTIFGLNFKILLFLPLIVLSIREVLRERSGIVQTIYSIAIFVALTFWIFLAQIYTFYDVGYSLSQFKDVVTTLAGCWFVRLFSRTPRNRDKFIRICLYATAFLGFAKIAIFSYCMLTGVPISIVIDALSEIFGVKLMTFDLAEALGRIQFPSDTMVPVCLFTILCMRKRLKIGSFTSFLVVVFLAASSVFSFSRFLYGYTALAAILGILVSKRDRVHWVYLAASTAVVAFYFKTLALLIEVRFSDRVADASDADRVAQSGALQRFFVDAPLLGHGFGSFTNVVIRQPNLPYNYEMQLLALSTQIGVIGMLFMFTLLLNYYSKAFTFAKGHRTYQTAVLLLLIAFLAGALFNPSVVSSIAAATYGLIFALASAEATNKEATSRSRPRTLMMVIRETMALSRAHA